jgi:integrase
MGITLNRENVAKLIEPGRIFFDDQLMGFGYRVRLDADGKLRASYIIQYRIGRQQRRQKIGDANKLSPDGARKRATEMLAKVTLGIDPGAEKEAMRAATALTFSAAVEQYLDLKKLEVRPTSLRLSTLYLTGKQYFGQMHTMPLTKVTRSDVATALNKITLASGAPTVGRARAHLSAFYTWAMKNGHCDQNPVIATVNPKTGPGGDRVLSDDELACVWRASGDDEFGKITKLLMLTGARRQEIGGLRWSEIDVEAGTMTIPGERTKNHRTLELKLPPQAMKIIASVPRMEDRDCLFGDRADIGFTQWQTGKRDLKDGITKAWRLHDIRRSVATGMAEIGIDPHIIEAVVNHASGHKGGIAGIYNHAKYKAQMKTALLLWSNHIDEIVNERA